MVFSFIIMLIASFLDLKKQGFERNEFILLLIGFLLIGFVWNFYLISFGIVLLIVLLLMIKFVPGTNEQGEPCKKSILHEGDLLIPAFAAVTPIDPILLVVAIPFAYFLTIFYKHITSKNVTGFIPYYTVAAFLLGLIILI